MREFLGLRYSEFPTVTIHLFPRGGKAKDVSLVIKHFTIKPYILI